MKTWDNIFESVVAPESLFVAWDVFRADKGKKPDVLQFEFELEQNIFELHRELKGKTYQHGPYKAFRICDPKPREIHKATVRDRVVHHAIFKVLYAAFEPTFIADSFSCRVDKGTHKGVRRLQAMIRTVSQNGKKPAYALKCDVKKFFDSVDHAVLLDILNKRIKDADLMDLLMKIVGGYEVTSQRERERERVIKPDQRTGVPIGNLTSQIFANIYLNELDQFVKHELKVKNYARYTDDFVIVANREAYLTQELLPRIEAFLQERLKLKLHLDKVLLQPVHRGVDFLGYVIFPHHRVLRTRTCKRMFRKMRQRIEEHKQGLATEKTIKQSMQSYLGVLSHANAYELSQQFKNQVWFWLWE